MWSIEENSTNYTYFETGIILDLLHIISIIMKLAIVLTGFKIATKKSKKYGWGIMLTFAIYVLYDVLNLLDQKIYPDLLYIIFFIATFSILWAVWQIYQDVKTEK
jgi:hypothetical protein